MVHAYSPESWAVASRICSHSWPIRVRLLGPREDPSLVQVMAPASGNAQSSFTSSPGCTEHTVGFEIWYFVGGSADRSEEEEEEEEEEWQGAKKRGRVGEEEAGDLRREINHHKTPMDALN